MAKLGQLLVTRGWINVQQLTRALQNQNKVGGRLGTCLLEMDALGEDLLTRSLSEQLGVPAVTIEELRAIPDEVLHLIPEKLARRCRAIPFRVAGGRLDVAMQDPRNLSCQDEIAFACGRRVKVHVGHEARIFEALQKFYGEECPSRYGLLLDRLNRMRYLWEKDQPKAPEASREQTLPALPLSELFAAEPAMAPPPLPEPATPPTPRPRMSGIRVRPLASPLPPPSMPPPGLPQDAGLPPLADLDLRANSRRSRAADPPAPPLRPIPAAVVPADLQPLAPELRRPTLLPEPSRTAPSPAPPRSAIPPGLPAPARSPAAPAAAALAPGRPIDLDATRDLSPTAAAPPPRETVALTADERTALGVGAEQAHLPPPTALEPGEPRPVAALEPREPRPPAALEPGQPRPAAALEPREPRPPAALDPREPRPPAALEPSEPRAPGSPGAASPPVAAPPAPGLATVAEVEAALGATCDREEVGRIVLDFLARDYRRVALFRVTRDRVGGWLAHGDGIDQAAFSRFAVGFDEPSVFLNLRQGSGMHLGPLPPMEAHRELARSWGGGLPRDSVVLPVRLGDRLVAVVYADGGSQGLGGIDLERMQRLTGAAAVAFERCIRALRGGGN